MDVSMHEYNYLDLLTRLHIALKTVKHFQIIITSCPSASTKMQYTEKLLDSDLERQLSLPVSVSFKELRLLSMENVSETILIIMVVNYTNKEIFSRIEALRQIKDVRLIKTIVLTSLKD